MSTPSRLPARSLRRKLPSQTMLSEVVGDSDLGVVGDVFLCSDQVGKHVVCKSTLWLVKEKLLIHTRDSVMLEMLQTNLAGVCVMVLVALCGSSARCCRGRWVEDSVVSTSSRSRREDKHIRTLLAGAHQIMPVAKATGCCDPRWMQPALGDVARRSRCLIFGFGGGLKLILTFSIINSYLSCL